ncbi:MAG TPA: FecR family protein [Burkholderiales bacterium]|nr:FecR family protein [Burkholderiales bacterium]
MITSPGSRVTLGFDDGQVVALHENTEFRIAEFYYRPQEPTADRAVFALLRGALRVVTGALGKRNRDAFALHVPQATIGIRGTDFMVAIVNPTYLSVLRGSVAATNVAGTVAFEGETFGSIETSSTLAVSIAPSALPGAAAAAFRSLGALPITPVDSSAGAGEINLAETAVPRAQDQDAASFGLDIANRARELNGDLGREFGQEVSESAGERARDRVPPHRERQ